jgi:hypothetical protein
MHPWIRYIIVRLDAGHMLRRIIIDNGTQANQESIEISDHHLESMPRCVSLSLIFCLSQFCSTAIDGIVLVSLEFVSIYVWPSLKSVHLEYCSTSG